MSSNHLAPVVWKLDSAIHRINRYPAVKYYDNQLHYPVDSAIHLSNNWGLLHLQKLDLMFIKTVNLIQWLFWNLFCIRVVNR